MDVIELNHRQAKAGILDMQVTRSRFLRWAFLGTAGAALVQLAAALAIFLKPQKMGTFGSMVTAGGVGDFAVGSVTRFQDARFYLVRLPEGFIALYQKCTHLGCTIPWKQQDTSEDTLAATGRFNCPCHGSIFDRYGVRKAGPAPRPLDLFPVSIVDGKVVVNTDPKTAILRDAWNPNHATKA